MSYYRLFYHFVWGTKNREQSILPEFESQLHSIIAAKIIELEGIVHAVAGWKIMSTLRSPFRRKYRCRDSLARSKAIVHM